MLKLDHARQLLEKYIGKPFFNYLGSEQRARMSVEEVERGLSWLESRFHVIKYVKVETERECGVCELRESGAGEVWGAVPAQVSPTPCRMTLLPSTGCWKWLAWQL